MDFLLSKCPEKKKGKKWAEWKRAIDNYKKYHLSYHMIVQFDYDEDAILVRDFIYKIDAEDKFEDLITANTRPTFEGFV
jgi:hypothetical protein